MTTKPNFQAFLHPLAEQDFNGTDTIINIAD